MLTEAGSSLQPLIDILAMPYNLTFDNSTGNFTLDYNDVGNVTSSVCLNIVKNGFENRTVLFNSCSSIKNDEISYSIGNSTGDFTARGYAVSNSDSNTYSFATLSVLRSAGNVLGSEGLIWGLLIILQMAIVGMVVTGGNPTGAIVGTLLGLVISSMLSLIAAPYTAVAGVVIVGGILVYKMRT
jgi:hypothetical protein